MEPSANKIFCSTYGCPGWVWASRRVQHCTYCQVPFLPVRSPAGAAKGGKGRSGPDAKGAGKYGGCLGKGLPPGQYQRAPPVLWPSGYPSPVAMPLQQYQQYYDPGQYAQQFPSLPPPRPQHRAGQEPSPKGAQPKRRAQSQTYASAARTPTSKPGLKPAEPPDRESKALVLARREVALYKELCEPGDPKLVRAQEALRAAKFAGLQAKDPSKQVQSITDQMGAHTHKMQCLLDEAAHIEGQMVSYAARHKSISHEVAELSRELDTLGVQLEVAKKAEQRVRPSESTAAAPADTVSSVVDVLGADFNSQLSNMAGRLQSCTGQMSPETKTVLEETFKALQGWSERITSAASKQQLADKHASSASPSPAPVHETQPGQLIGSLLSTPEEEPFIEGAGGPPFDDLDDLDDPDEFEEEFEDDAEPSQRRGGGADGEEDRAMAGCPPPGSSARGRLTGPPEGVPDSLKDEPPIQEVARSSQNVCSILQDFQESANLLSTYAAQEADKSQSQRLHPRSRSPQKGGKGGSAGSRTAPYPPSHSSGSI